MKSDFPSRFLFHSSLSHSLFLCHFDKTRTQTAQIKMSYGIFVSFRFFYLWMGMYLRFLVGIVAVGVVVFGTIRCSKNGEKENKTKTTCWRNGMLSKRKESEVSTKWKYLIAKRKYFALKWISEECCHVGKCLLQMRGDEKGNETKNATEKTNERMNEHKVIAKWNGAFEFKILQSLPNLNFNLTC